MVFRFIDPRNPFQQLREDMNRLLSGFLGPTANGTRPAAGRPPVNVWENDEALMVELEVPGLKSDQLDLSVHGGELSIQLQRPDVQQEGVVYHRRERPFGKFDRVIRLPADVAPDRVEAKLGDGVLTITLPKAESAKPRTIEVTSAE